LSCLAGGVNWHNSNRVVAPPIPADRGRITKQSSVCFPVSVGRLELKCFQLAAKSSGRPQQLQLCQQRVPCSRCGDRESPVADSSTCPRHDEVTRRRSTQCRPSGLSSIRSNIYVRSKADVKQLNDLDNKSRNWSAVEFI